MYTGGIMVNFNNDWDELLKGEFEKDYYVQLRRKLINEYRTHRIYPNIPITVRDRLTD